MSLKIDIQVQVSGEYTMSSLTEWDDVDKTETGLMDVQKIGNLDLHRLLPTVLKHTFHTVESYT